jgi:lactoylglutathione lyase
MSEIRLEHVAVWAWDVERMREFYVTMLHGQSSVLYENSRTGFRSYFISFRDSARLELMSRQSGPRREESEPAVFGYAHVAFRLGSRAAVDAWVARLEAQGVAVLGRPRQTGDGYYEAVVADAEGNAVELAE